jgi:hypothetical protein
MLLFSLPNIHQYSILPSKQQQLGIGIGREKGGHFPPILYANGCIGIVGRFLGSRTKPMDGRVDDDEVERRGDSVGEWKWRRMAEIEAQDLRDILGIGIGVDNRERQ